MLHHSSRPLQPLRLFQSSRWFQRYSRVAMMGAIAMIMVGCTASEPATTEPTAESVDASSTPVDPPNVVATTSVVCDLTQQIAGETVDLTCLLQPGQDPHTYEPTPSDRRALEEADLILADGYNFSPDIAQLVTATQGKTVVNVLEVAVPDPLMGLPHTHDHGDDHAHDHGDDHAEEAHSHEEEHSHEHADEHTEHGEAETAQVPDPHVWHNPQHGASMVTVIEEALGAIAPDQQAQYQQNAQAIRDELVALDAWIAQQTATVPADNRKLVTTHDSFRYFAETYGFTVAGALSGLSTEAEISAQRLTELVDLVKAASVPAIFAETTTNVKQIETVARDANVAVAPQALFVEGAGGEGSAAETYQQMLVVNTCTIVDALGGQCDRDGAPVEIP